MKRFLLCIQNWIKKYPIEGFFLLAMVLCFGTLLPAFYLISRNTTTGQILGFYLGRMGAFSPVLSGLLVTWILQPAGQTVSIRNRWKKLLPIWFVILIVCVAEWKSTAPPGVPPSGLILLSLPVSLLPAWVLSSAFNGTNEVRNMLATLVKPSGRGIYYIVALLTFPAIHILGTVLANMLHGRSWFPKVNQGANLAYAVFVTFFSVLIFAGGLNEESGWRGFAQKRLQTKYNPLTAIFILWLLVAIWHIPNDLLQFRNGGNAMFRLVIYLFITMLFSWIYNRTGGSILAVAIFHASMNSMNPLTGIFPLTTTGILLLIGFAMTAMMQDRMWCKLPKDHPAVHQLSA